MRDETRLSPDDETTAAAAAAVGESRVPTSERGTGRGQEKRRNAPRRPSETPGVGDLGSAEVGAEPWSRSSPAVETPYICIYIINILNMYAAARVDAVTIIFVRAGGSPGRENAAVRPCGDTAARRSSDGAGAPLPVPI